MKKSSQATGYAIGEISFIILPFIVMIIIYIYLNKLNNILYEPEWSLASSVMFGQSIIKMIHAINNGTKGKKVHLKSYNIGAMISLLIVIGLIPSLIVLSLIFTSKEIPNWLMIMQIIYFIFAITIFTIANVMQIKFEEDNE